jgi:outer membrane protein TolC
MPLYQVNQIALAEQQRIKNDLSLTAEEREKALQHVLQEQQKSMRQILGDKPVSSLPPRSTDEDIGPPLPEELPRP